MDRGAWWATVHGVEKETQLAATQQTVTFVCVLLSHGRLFVTPWTQLARLLCLWGFSRQEYWRGLSCASPGYLLNPGIEPRSPHTAGGFFTIWVAREAQEYWSGLSCILHGIFSTQGFNPGLPTLQADSFTVWATREAQEYWSGEPVSSPGDLPNPGSESGSPRLQADSLQ